MPAKTNVNRLDDLALALASGSTVLDFCRARRISPSAAYSWKHAPGFDERVRQYRAALREKTLAILASRAAGVGPSVPANPPLTAA
jgi:hypothetical protein